MRYVSAEVLLGRRDGVRMFGKSSVVILCVFALLLSFGMLMVSIKNKGQTADRDKVVGMHLYLHSILGKAAFEHWTVDELESKTSAQVKIVVEGNRGSLEELPDREGEFDSLLVIPVGIFRLDGDRITEYYVTNKFVTR